MRSLIRSSQQELCNDLSANNYDVCDSGDEGAGSNEAWPPRGGGGVAGGRGGGGTEPGTWGTEGISQTALQHPDAHVSWQIAPSEVRWWW